MLELLRRERTLRLLLLAKTASFAGDTVLLLALPYFLYTSTGSVTATAGVLLVAAVPNALLGPLLGALADRVEPRRLLIACDAVSAVMAGSLVLVAGGEHRWLVYVAAFVLVSCGQTVSFTRGAITPRIVPAEDVLTANSLESAVLSLVRMAAPPVGGLLYAVVGLKWLLVFDALTFVVSAAWVWRASLPPRVEEPATARGKGPGRVRRVLSPRGLTGRLVWITGGYFLVSQAMNVLLIPFVRLEFHGGAVSVGLLSASGALGALLGAMLCVRAQAWLGPLPALGALIVAEGLARLLLTVMPDLVTAAAAVLLVGAAATAFLALLQTTLQQCVEPGFVGRLLGITWSVAGFATIAGMLLFTGQASYLAPVRVLQESSLLCVLLGLLALVALRPGGLPAAAPAPAVGTGAGGYADRP